MVVQHNISALNVLNNLAKNQNKMNHIIGNLSSGYRINRAADDPSGFVRSEKLKTQIRGLQQADRNIQDGISLIETADGALSEIHNLLQRGRELSVQAANGTYTEAEKSNIQDEIVQVRDEINRISNDTEFNTKKLLNHDSSDGSESEDPVNPQNNSGIMVQVGANSSNTIQIPLFNAGATKLGIDTIDVTIDADNAISVFDKAVQTVSQHRSQFGAVQNRLESALDNVNNYELNLEESLSRIEDADMAKEMVEFVKYQLLTQVSQMMLVQANQQPNLVLQLLKN